MIVILHNIRSMHNVGAIFRTADALGCVEKIYLTGITPAPIDEYGKLREPIAKVSLGAEKYIPWDSSARSNQAVNKIISRLKNDGYKVLAIEQDKNSIPYNKLPKSYLRNFKFCLIVGNEVKGLPPSILKNVDAILEIPMRGALVKQAEHPKRKHIGKESLNVGISFGIVAFHLVNS